VSANEPVSPCILGKCREILAKCREADIANLAKSHQISIAWMGSPYSSEQGRSRETMLSSRVVNLPAYFAYYGYIERLNAVCFGRPGAPGH
jgi:hypothetical protein